MAIISSFSRKNLRSVDLSCNEMHGAPARALAGFFAENPTVLHSLFLTKCGLRCSDVDMISRGLIAHSGDVYTGISNHELCEWVLDSNRIKGIGAQSISYYLKGDGCKLEILSLNWNELGLMGAEYMASAVAFVSKKTGKGCTLTELHLSCNNLGDMGAQNMAAALAFNTRLSLLSLTHNSMGGRACFILSKVLSSPHPTLRRVNISSNPLGEAGARCLFRIILKYRIKCFVVMRDCTFSFEANSFDSTNPANGSPYSLDTSDPYQAALLHELINLAVISENHLTFDSVSVRERSNSAGRGGAKAFGSEVSHHVVAEDGQMYNKGSKNPWRPPQDAMVTITCSQYKEKPSLESAVSKETLELFVLVVANAGSEMDRRNWIRLNCMDMYFTTEQIEYMIQSFTEKMVQINLLHIFSFVWTRLLDTENKYDFLCKHLGPSDRHELINILSFEKFKFNWINCTGHWYLDLGNQRAREVMVDLIALNNVERHFSKDQSGRLDTSQKGNWCNFRNETYMNRTNEIAVDEEFISNLPYHGCLEFDYVSTTCSKTKENVKTITYEEKMSLYANVGLSKRSRLPRSKSIIAFLELQIASCKYYFTCLDVIGFMHSFDEEERTQSKVVITLFSRIFDLENFILILRELSPRAVDIVASCLGWLNIGNPLLPYQDYDLRLTFHDNRLFANLLLNLGAMETGDNIKETKGSEFLLIEAYASLGRLLSDTNPKRLKFSYQQLTEKSLEPRWDLRRDLMKNFLIGTVPIRKDVFACIKQYKEMEQDGFLTRGPIDLQYKAYLKSEIKHQKDQKLARREIQKKAAAAAASQSTGYTRDARGRMSVLPSRPVAQFEGTKSSVDAGSELRENEGEL